MKVNLKVLKSIFNTYGVLPIENIKGAKEALASGQQEKAQAQHEPILVGADFVWSDEDSAYHKDNQIIYSLGNKVYLWVVDGQLARVLQGSDKLQKWIQGDEKYPEGKVNSFLSTYSEMVGEEPVGGGKGGSITLGGKPFKTATPSPSGLDKPSPEPSDLDKGEPGEIGLEPMDGPPASRLAAAPEKSEVDKIIQSYLTKAGIKAGTKLSKQPPIRLGSDEIIDLYKKATSMKETDPEGAEKLMSFIKTLRVLEEGKILKSNFDTLVRGIVRGIVNEIKEATEKAKKKKENPDFPKPGPGKEDEPHSQMDWEPSAEKKPKYGEEDRGTDYEAWLEDLANKMWRDPEDIGHSHQGWRVKRVVSHGSGTKAYLLTLTKQYHKSRIFLNRNGKWSWTDPINRGQGWQDLDIMHPADEPEIEQEQSTTGAASPVTGPNAFKKQNKPMEEEKPIEEMTTTNSGTPGYNVPGFISRRGGSSAGVKGSEKLGYTLTPIGKKDMEKHGDKLLESSMGSLGAKFGAAQRAYDAQSPPDEPEAMECPKCGQEAGFITKNGKRGGSWWWEAKCNKCGNKWGDDNF